MTQTKAELLETKHQGDIRLGDANSSHYVGLKAPATVASNLVWTLPAADGTANYLLKTDGSGNLGWVADSTTDSTKMPLAGGTFTGNVTVSGNYLDIQDTKKLRLGTDGDCEFYHSGGANFIKTGSQIIHILTDSSIRLQKNTGTENMLIAHADGAVELYYDNFRSFLTDANGITVYGPEGGDCVVALYADEGDDNADKWKLTTDTSGNFKVSNKSTGSWVDGLTLDGSNNATFAGTITTDDIAADRIMHRGDVDTTIRFPAADTFAVETGGSERLRVDSSGRLLIGHTSSLGEVWNNDGGSLQVAGTSYLNSTVQVSRWTNSASCPHFIMGKSRGGAVGTNVVVQDGDTCGLMVFAADDGTDLQSAVAQIAAVVDGTPGSNDTPGRLTFSTTADGSNSVTERLRITSAGSFGIAGANYGSSGQVLTSGGSGSAVSWADAGGGGFASVQYFTSSGTWTKPSGIKIIRVTVLGGGGGGGCTHSVYSYGGNGGGGGGLSQKIIDVTSISSETVTIGSGGSNASGNQAGGSGGTTSFGSHCSASGGSGGAGTINGSSAHAATTAGVGSNGNINLRGGYGEIGMRGQHYAAGGTGGASPLWGVDSPGGLGQGGGSIVTPGSGGGGAATGGSTGGGAGLVVVEEFK